MLDSYYMFCKPVQLVINNMYCNTDVWIIFKYGGNGVDHLNCMDIESTISWANELIELMNLFIAFVLLGSWAPFSILSYRKCFNNNKANEVCF